MKEPNQDARILELDWTWEDTPRWKALREAFASLSAAEQKCALRQAREECRRAFARDVRDPERAQEMHERAAGHVDSLVARRFRFLLRAWALWVRHPHGRIGSCRKESARRRREMAKLEQIRFDQWSEWSTIKTLGLPMLEQVLATLPQRREAEAIERASRRAKRLAQAERWVLFPIYACGWAAGAVARQWREGRQRAGEGGEPERKTESPPAKGKRGARRL
jgi:hypothetical protein